MILKDLLKDFEYKLHGASADTEIECVTTDIKSHTDNCLYILLKPKSDIKNLPKSGGVAILGGEPEEKLHLPYIVCSDIRAAMAYIYSRFYGINYKRLSFIGITGTNGKSSTLTLLSNILTADGHSVGCIKTGEIKIKSRTITGDAYSMTTPDPEALYKSIREMQDAGCDTVIMEVSSHSLALRKVEPIFFDYAIFTGLSPEHLDFHGDMEEYYKTKRRLFDKTRCAVVNIDDEYGMRLYSELDIKKYSFGVVSDSDAYIDNYEYLGFSGSSFKFRLGERNINLRLPLIGSFNVYNALGAITVSCDIEVSPYIIRDAIRNTEIIEGRFQILSHSPTVIVDYAHTSLAFECFLRELCRLKENKSVTVIFGAGGERDKGKRERMGRLAERYADKIILTSDNSRSEEPMSIIRDILGGISKKQVYVDIERGRAVKDAVLSAGENEIVAIIGKGAEKYNIDKSGYHEYDEIALIKKLLAARGEKDENKA